MNDATDSTVASTSTGPKSGSKRRRRSGPSSTEEEKRKKNRLWKAKSRQLLSEERKSNQKETNKQQKAEKRKSVSSQELSTLTEQDFIRYTKGTKFDIDFQKDLASAVLLYYANSGLYEFGQLRSLCGGSVGEDDDDDGDQSIGVAEIIKEIEDSVLSDSELESLVDRFYTSHSFVDGNLMSCGCCGWRQMTPSTSSALDYKLVPLCSEMGSYLLLQNVDVRNYLCVKAQGEIEVPTAEATVSGKLMPWKVFSVYELQRDQHSGGTQYFGVHPELVEESVAHGPFIRVCPTCYQHMKTKRKASPLSITAGLDFGSAERVGLPALTLAEQMVIARCRLFFAGLKLSPNTTGRVNFDFRSEVKGHAILFRDDSAEVVAQKLLLDKAKLEKSIQLYLIDGSAKGEPDKLAKKMLGSAVLLVRSWVVYQWLVVLQRVNPYYNDLPELNRGEVQAAVETMNQSIIDSTELINDKESVAFENQLGSDVARVQTTEPKTGDRFDGCSAIPIGKEGGETEILPLRCSFVMDAETDTSMAASRTSDSALLLSMKKMISNRASWRQDRHPSEPNQHDANVDNETSVSSDSGFQEFTTWEDSSIVDERAAMDESTIHHSLATENIQPPNSSVLDEQLSEEDSISSCGYEPFFGLEEDGREQCEQQLDSDGDSCSCLDEVPLPLLTSRRSDKPVNEIEASDETLLLAFPNIFILGNGHGRSAGKLSKIQRAHLFQQFTLAPSKDRLLMGFVRNSVQRFQVNNGVKSHVRENPDSVYAVKELFENPKKLAQLEKALEHPDSKYASKIAMRYFPHMRFSGQNVTYGAVEGHQLKSKTFENCKRFGMPSGFLTLSFNETDNPRCVRSCFRTISNAKFPAVFDDDSPYGTSGVEFMEYLRQQGDVVSTGLLPQTRSKGVNLDKGQRSRLAMNNPLVFVAESKELIHNVLSILFCKPPEGFGGFREGPSSRKTRYFKRSKGALGHTLAYIGVVEDHAKGTLHYHLLFFGGLPSFVLQKFADRDDLVPAIGRALDTIYRSQLPENCHAAHIVRNLLWKGPYIRKDYHEALTEQKLPSLNRTVGSPLLERHSSVLLKSGDSSGDRTECRHRQLWKETNLQAAVQQYHVHLATCHKGALGDTGCRLCMKAGIVPRTMPVDLEWCLECDPALGIEEAQPTEEDFVVMTGDKAPCASSIENDKNKGSDEVSREFVPFVGGFMKTNESERAKGYRVSPSGVYVGQSRVGQPGTHVGGEFPPKTFFKVMNKNEKAFSFRRHCPVEPRGGMLKEVKSDPFYKEPQKSVATWEISRPVLGQELPKPNMKNGVLYNRSEIFNSIRHLLEGTPGGEAQSPFWTWLDRRTDEQIFLLFNDLVSELYDANGSIGSFNPLVSYCTGSHNNLQLLGSTDQALAAIFYICPYIAKRKVPLQESLVLLNRAYKLAQLYKSQSEHDAGTDRRMAAHVLQKTLNMMNLKMELSDYLIAASVLGLPCIISSETYAYGKTEADIGYRMHIARYGGDAMAVENLVGNDRNKRRELRQEALHGYDENSHSDLQSSALGSSNVDNASGESARCSVLGSSLNTRTVNSRELDMGGVSSLKNHGCDSLFQRAHSSLPDTSILPPTRVKSQRRNNIGKILRFSVAKQKSPLLVPQPALYSFRGYLLRSLNRYEYRALVQVKRAGMSTSRMTRFPFHDGFLLHSLYDQSLKAKQDTVILTDKWPKHPGDKPKSDALPSDHVVWRKKADLFADRVLTEFRAEDKHYGGHVPVGEWQYTYNWEALQEWIAECQQSDSIVAKFRLAAAVRRVQALHPGAYLQKQVLFAYRARNRTLWTKRDKARHNTRTRLEELARRANEEHMNSTDFQESYSALSRQQNQSLKDANESALDIRNKFNELAPLKIVGNDKVGHVLNQRITAIGREYYFDGEAGDEAEAIHAVQELGSCTTKFDPSTYKKNSPTARGSDSDVPVFIATVASQEQVPLSKDMFDGSTVDGSLPEVVVTVEEIGSPLDDDERCLRKQSTTECRNGEDVAFVAPPGLSRRETGDLLASHLRKTLNEKQKQLFDMYWRYFRDPDDFPPTGKLVLVHGQGGSGKTEAIKRLDQIAPYYSKRILKTSWNHINALAFEGGVTTASLVAMGSPDRFEEMRTQKIRELQELLTDVALIVIDEVSNQAPWYLAKLSTAISQATGIDKPFGGLPLCMVGDYSQKGPVKAGLPTPDVLMDMYATAHANRRKQMSSGDTTETDTGSLDPLHGVARPSIEASNPKEVGCAMLSEVRLLEMDTQMRINKGSKDHAESVENMYRGGRLRPEKLMANYARLGSKDYEQGPEPDWSMVPFVVRTNKQRFTITDLAAARFAKLKGTVVIRWEAERRSWEQCPTSVEYQESAIANDPSFFEYFVPSSGAYINATVNKHLRLVNATSVKLHSVTLKTPELNDWLRNQISKTDPGGIITLPSGEKPVAVTVAVNTHNMPSSIQQAYQDMGYPILRKTKYQTTHLVPLVEQKRRDWLRVPIFGGDGYKPSRVQVRPYFPFETGFAITTVKAQGQTLDRVILFISADRSGNHMTYEDLYVSFSRVRHGSNIRLFLVGGSYQQQLKSIMFTANLKPPIATHSFLSGFQGGRANQAHDNADEPAWLQVAWNPAVALNRLWYLQSENIFGGPLGVRTSSHSDIVKGH